MVTRKKLETVLCDLDGTLVSSFSANYEAYKLAINKFGETIDVSTFRQVWGHDSSKFLAELFPKLSVFEINHIRSLKADYYPQFVHRSMINHDLMQALVILSEFCQIGLVTTAKEANVAAVLKHHEIDDLFDIVVNGDEVTRPKPDPEPYLLALQRLSADPTTTIAIEDSEVGQTSAERANIRCIRVRSFDV